MENALSEKNLEELTMKILKVNKLRLAETQDTPGLFSNNLDITDEEVEEYSTYPIREIIGCLMWLCTMTRPEIAFSVISAARVQHRPNAILWKWIIRIARYLKKTAHYGLIFTRPKNMSTMQIIQAFVDISFCPQLNLYKGKCPVGWALKFFGATVLWDSTVTRRVMGSTAEAECNGLDLVLREVIWHRHFHELVGIFKVIGPTVIWEDNTAACTLVKDNVFHKRTKHFAIEFYKTKEAQAVGEIDVQWIDTDSQIADTLTKATVGEKLAKHRCGLLGPDELQTHFGPPMVPPLDPSL